MHLVQSESAFCKKQTGIVMQSSANAPTSEQDMLMCTDEKDILAHVYASRAHRVAGLLADESSSDQGEASAGSNSDWRPLAVTTIAEAGIRKSIPEGVDFVMAINGQ